MPCDSIGVSARSPDRLPCKFRLQHPCEPDALPKADAIIWAGASFNRINKWALGVVDMLTLGIFTEVIGLGLAVVVLFVNRALVAIQRGTRVSPPCERPA